MNEIEVRERRVSLEASLVNELFVMIDQLHNANYALLHIIDGDKSERKKKSLEFCRLDIESALNLLRSAKIELELR